MNSCQPKIWANWSKLAFFDTASNYPDTSGKCTVEVPICPGMGATNLIFWAPRS